MDFERIRKQKIDKTYIDEAFKEIPMYESMAVSSDRDSYRLAKELLAMGHAQPQPIYRQPSDNVSEVSAPTLQSLYFSPDPTHNDTLMQDNSRASSQTKLTSREERSNLDAIYGAERNLLPLILKEKPLESPSKVRYEEHVRAEMDEKFGINYVRAESHPIRDDINQDSFPSWEEIAEFRGKYTDVKRSIIKALIDDLQKKENDFFTINSLQCEKTNRSYPYKIFHLLESQEEITDPKVLRYKENYNIIRAKLAYYYELEFKKLEGVQDHRKPLIYLYLIYQKGKTWEYVKIMVEGTRSKGVYYRYSQFNPFSTIDSIPSEIMDRYVENVLKSLISPQPVIKKASNRRQRVDKLFSENTTAVWDSGIEVYKRVAKDYLKLSQEKVSREQLAFFLMERFYDRQIAH